MPGPDGNAPPPPPLPADGGVDEVVLWAIGGSGSGFGSGADFTARRGLADLTLGSDRPLLFGLRRGWDIPPLTGIALLDLDAGDFMPPGF